MMNLLLTNKEVATAIYVDDDYDAAELTRLSEAATSFVYQKTGFNFAEEKEIEPLAKQCAVLYVRQQFFSASEYKQEFDYTFGISSLICDLQDIARRKV